jgi:hypothetical protein
VSSPNFVGPLPATRAVGRCEATDAVPTGTRRRRPIPHRSGRNSALLCIRNAFASARLCRSLPSFAFHLASPVICRERASRRERDGSMQSQPGISSRNGTSLPRAQKYPSHLAHSDGKPRVQLSSHATRAQSGLCRPIWVSLRACQLHIPWAMHTGCTRPAGSSGRASVKPPPVARVRALPWYSCDLIEVAAPNGFRLPLVAGIWVYHACLPTLERRDVRGRPR